MMKKNLQILFLAISLPVLSQTSFNLDRDWGTYFGDERFSLQGSERDSNGNLYITGYVLDGILIEIDNETGEPTGNQTDYGNTTNDFDFFDNAPHQNIHGGGGSDGFIAKFSPSGALLWATFLGGENFDVIEDITIDRDNNVYVFGFTESFSGIATPNASQTEKAGNVDLFMSKFAPDGDIVWSTYYGDATSSSDTSSLASIYLLSFHFNNIDPDGNYIVHDRESNLYITSGAGWANSQPATVTPTNGFGKDFLAKFTDNGEFVWSTAYGNNSNSEITGVCFCNNALYVTGYIQTLPPNANSSSYYGSQGAYQPMATTSPFESWIAKFNADGERVWGTYYGGTGAEILKGNNLECDGKGTVYQAIHTTSNNMATTGAYQEVINGTALF